MGKNRSEENKTIKAKKVVARAMKREAEDQMNELDKNLNNIVKMARFMKKKARDVKGGRFIRKSDRKLAFNEKDRGNIRKVQMESIMNEEREWDQITDADTVEGPAERVTRDKIIKAMRKMKTRKAAGPPEVCAEMISARRVLGIEVMMKLCQSVPVYKEKQCWKQG